MIKKMPVLCALALAVLPLSATAQEFVIGAGATDFPSGGEDGAILELEYRFLPFKERRVLSLSWGATFNATDSGDVFVGGGLWSRWQLNDRWFTDLSVMPGLFEEGDNGNDLGLAFEIRSLAGLGYRFDSGAAISVAITHKSNAGLSSTNPGAEAVLLRYHHSF